MRRHHRRFRSAIFTAATGLTAATALAAVAGLATLGIDPTPASANPEGTQPVITEAITRSYQFSPEDANAAELYNPTDSSINISGWTLQFYDAGGTVTTFVEFGVTVAPISIPAGDFIIVKDPNYSLMFAGTGTVVNYPNVSGFDELPDDGGVALFDGATRIDGLAMTAFSPAVEGGPAEGLDATTDAVGQDHDHEVTLQRDIFATDTDNNGDDFSYHLSTWGSLV